MSQEALIIVDIQNDYFPDGKLPTFQPVQTAEACAQLIKKFRAEEKEVVFIKHIVDEAHREVIHSLSQDLMVLKSMILSNLSLLKRSLSNTKSLLLSILTSRNIL